MQYSYIFEIIRESGVRLRGERQKKILGLNSFDEVYCYGTRVRTTYSTATLSAVILFYFFLPPRARVWCVYYLLFHFVFETTTTTTTRPKTTTSRLYTKPFHNNQKET